MSRIAVPLSAFLAAGSCDFWHDGDEAWGRVEIEDADLEIFANLMPGGPEDPVVARVELLLNNRSGRELNVEIDRATVWLAADGRQLFAFDVAPDRWSGDLDPWQSRRGAWVKQDTLASPETPCGEPVFARVLVLVRSASWWDDGAVLDALTIDTATTPFGCAY